MSSTTDWMQALSAMTSVVITGAGTILVVRTLKLQQKTLDDQKQMLQLTIDEEKTSQQPVFNIQDLSERQGQLITRVVFRLSVEDKTAYNVTLHPERDSPFTFANLITARGHIKQDDHIDIELSRYIGNGESLALTIMFCDIKRRYYRQKVFGDSFDFRITLPKAVNH